MTDHPHILSMTCTHPQGAVKRNGKCDVTGKQRWKCNRCGRQFVDPSRDNEPTKKVKPKRVQPSGLSVIEAAEAERAKRLAERRAAKH